MVLFPLQVRFTLYHVPLDTGADPVMLLQFVFTRGAVTELHVCHVVTPPSGLLY